ncbi:acid phosphatase-related [Holotrichia oblita]|uniref:Acid phosphatase-related n=1 Tax=Holotrichia oblita TaxID=644536 RepID=A0ACB9SX02_HOLOL|nr:acid phosphatase-related [Holotrichia oblita]
MYVREHSGDFNEKYVFAYNIYSTLLAESEMGLPVPEWAATIFPDTLANIAKTEMDQMYRGKNKILGSAHIMEKIVNDTIAMLEGVKEVRG